MDTINNLTHKIIGCAMAVHNDIGTGFQEVIYQKALEIEFQYNHISYIREKEMHIHYRGHHIGTRRVDFFVENLVMLELKAVEKLLPVHKTQAINYLEVYGLADGLLINFGGTSLEFNRVYNNKMRTGLKNSKDTHDD